MWPEYKITVDLINFNTIQNQSLEILDIPELKIISRESRKCPKNWSKLLSIVLDTGIPGMKALVGTEYKLEIIIIS